MANDFECEMCGKTRALVGRWYQYDNGEQALLKVCCGCAYLHDSLLKRGAPA